MRFARHEQKYLISFSDYKFLSHALGQVLKRDPHANADGGYVVRSIYFDTLGHRAFYEKLDGVPLRKKIRLRTYSVHDRTVKLEIKHKATDRVFKESTSISPEDAAALIEGRRECLLKYDDPVSGRVYAEFSTEHYRPVVMMDYWREAFTYGVNGVRITFDRFLSKHSGRFDIFSTRARKSRIQDGRTVIMEVKYDRCLPEWIKTIVQNTGHNRMAISKFCMGRIGEPQ